MPKVEIYDSLDAPVFVWDKVIHTDDLTYLLVNRKKVKEVPLKKLEEAWEKLYDEFTQEFGFSDTFKSITMKKVEIAMLKCKLIRTEDRSYETDIEIAELELDDLNNSVSGSGLGEIKIEIEKKMGFQLNMMTTSIREFYMYLKAVA